MHGAVRTWVTDAGHLPSEVDPKAPLAGRRRARFTFEVVETATARSMREKWRSAVSCVGRFGRKLCRGRIEVALVGDELIEWVCAKCGEQGTITGFTAGDHDLSGYVSKGKKVLWGFDDDQRDLLLAGSAAIPRVRAVVARARPHAEIQGLLFLEATVPELDEVYTLVEDLTRATRDDSLRRELLDGLRDSLCTSIDGF